MISKDKIRNKYVRYSTRVTSIVEKMRKNILRWLKDVLRREKTKAVRLVMGMYTEKRAEEED